MLNSLVTVFLPKEALDLIIEAIKSVNVNFCSELQNRQDFLALAEKSGYSDNHLMVLADTCVEIEAQIGDNEEELAISLLASQWELCALCVLIISRCLEEDKNISSDSIATSVTLKILGDEIITQLRNSLLGASVRPQQNQLE